MTQEPQAKVIVYGAPASLYTAKVRAFLSAFHIPFEERFPSHPRYRQVIKPAAETHRIPVVEFPDGEIVQDSTQILDAFEQRFPQGSLGPRQQLVTHLLEVLADRGLTKPAMHFRWSFLGENEAYLTGEFGRSLAFPGPPEEVERLGRRVVGKMSAYLPMLGIDARSIPTIERVYAQTLALFEAHFAAHPYALGGAPTRGDCALMGPMFGHLGRDPYPRHMMQKTAPLTFRWTERMTWGERRTPEFPDVELAPLADDAVPPTLVALMRHLFAGFAEDLVQSAGRFNAWVAENADAAPGAWISPEGADQPPLGPIVVDYYGVALEQQALGHPMWLLQRALAFMAGLPDAERAACQALIDEVGATGPMAVRFTRAPTRVRNRLAVT